MARRAGNAKSKRLSFCWQAGVLLALIALILASSLPHKAFAWFNDVTDSYPATQEVSVSGDVLTGADIPEGAYSITATTSSYMCKITDVTLTSAGGQLWATFTISKAYNALYLGTAEEAAANTNEDGTDYSAYYVVDPLEGYVARQFSLPIPAVNQQMTIAAFSGGNKGIDKGMWYTRTVVFNSSDAVSKAIEDAKNPPAQQDNSSSNGGNEQGDAAQSADTEVTAPTSVDNTADTTDTTDANEKESKKSTTNSAKTSTSSTNSTTASGATSSGTGVGVGTTRQSGDSKTLSAEDDKDKSAESTSASGGQQATAASPNAVIGQAISFVSEVDIPLTDLPTDVARVDRQDAQGDDGVGTAVAIVGVVVVNLALAGAFVVGARRARPKQIWESKERESGY